MQRKTIELLFHTTFKRISSLSAANRHPLRCNLHVSRHRYNVVEAPTAHPIASVESISDFSSHDPDQFGTLNPVSDINEKLAKMPDEEDDKVEFLLEDETGRKVRRNMNYYHNLIEKFIKEKKVADAIDVLEERMLKRDKVKPDYYTYNLLINGCASVGYTQKAFKLYNKMKQAGVKSTPATFTGLFNACANALIPEEGLIRVNNLRRQLEEKGQVLNSIHYNALIKAYARLNDVKAAFLVVDEMMARKIKVDHSTFTFLLQACASDKEAGFRHALILWHKMRRRFITPDTFVFNQFLRCVRDCGIGDVNETIESVKLIAERANKWRITQGDEIASNELAQTQLSNDVIDVEDLPKDYPSNDLALLEIKENRPNLLAPIPHLGSIIELKDVNTSTDRLLLLGGFRNFLEVMKSYDAKPDIKTFTMLLDMIPATLSAEEALMEEMNKLKINMDIDFCNMLIKKRACRRDNENGRAVLEIIQENYLNPDIVTFGVLALCCSRTSEARQLIRDMRQFGYRLNIEIIGGMLKQACYTYNFDYMHFLLKLMARMQIQPNEKIMENLKITMSSAAKHFNIQQNRKKDKTRKDLNPASFERYKIFKDYYKQWKNENTVYKPPHPYKQFKVRHEPQNEEEEELLELQENSKPRNIEAKSQASNEPKKGPAKWRKPKAQVFDLETSNERRRYVKRPQNKKFLEDAPKSERSSKPIMKFKAYRVDESETGISEKSDRKLIWRRADDMMENENNDLDKFEEGSDKNTRKLAWKNSDSVEAN